MNRVKAIIKASNFTQGRVFPLSMGYASWETDEVIAEELYRNLALAIICIFLTTLFLLANVTASILGNFTLELQSEAEIAAVCRVIS